MRVAGYSPYNFTSINLYLISILLAVKHTEGQAQKQTSVTFPKTCFEIKQNDLGSGPPGPPGSSVLSWGRTSKPGDAGALSYSQGPNSHPDHLLTVAEKQERQNV